MITRILLALFLLFPPSLWASATVFNATSTKVAVNSMAAVEGTTISVGCWTYRVGHGEGTNSGIFTKIGDSGADGWWLHDRNSTNAQYRLYAGFDTTGGIWSIVRPADTTWTHVLFTYTWSGTTAPVVYVNGASVTVSVVTTPSGARLGTTQPLVIGNRPLQDITWNGRLANCTFHNVILTANEVKAVKECPQSVSRGRIGVWPLGVFGGRNYTSTASLNMTETDTAVSATGPPVNCPQGSSRGLRWR